MKLRDDFVFQSLGKEFFLIPVGKAAERFHGMARLNETAGFVVERLKTGTDPAQIVDAMLAEYKVDRPTAQAHVDALIEKLRGVGALEE